MTNEYIAGLVIIMYISAALFIAGTIAFIVYEITNRKK